MPGMIQAQPRDSDSAATTPTTPPAGAPKGSMDPILTQIKDGIETKIPPDQKDALDRIVTAGMKILYDAKTHPAIQKIYDVVAQGGFQPTQIATGMVNLMGMVMKASQGTASLPALYPAGVVLLCYVLDDLEKTRGLTVTKPLVGQIVEQMKTMFLKLKVSDGSAPQGAAQPGAPPTPPPTPQPAMGGA